MLRNYARFINCIMKTRPLVISHGSVRNVMFVFPFDVILDM